jgi:hypothetical protein
MEFKGEDCLVTFNELKNTIEFFGTIRLRDSSDYKSIGDLLENALCTVAQELVLDFRNLQFLNSAGINTISKFIIAARCSDKVNVKVMGNEQISWQQKSLRNLQKLWPKVQIEIS